MSRRSLLLSLAFAGALACSNGKGGKDGGGDAGPGCRSNADCDGGLICGSVDGGLAKCEGCTTNGQCLPQQGCSPTQHVCDYLPGWGNQCVLNGDCTLGLFCMQGLCVSQVTPCTNNHCPTGLRCNQQNQVCEQDLGCASNNDCPANQTCNTGTRACQPTCTAATAAQICQPTQKCVGSICVDCTSNADCGPGITCNVAEGKCRGRRDLLHQRGLPGRAGLHTRDPQLRIDPAALPLERRLCLRSGLRSHDGELRLGELPARRLLPQREPERGRADPGRRELHEPLALQRHGRGPAAGLVLRQPAVGRRHPGHHSGRRHRLRVHL